MCCSHSSRTQKRWRITIIIQTGLYKQIQGQCRWWISFITLVLLASYLHKHCSHPLHDWHYHTRINFMNNWMTYSWLKINNNQHFLRLGIILGIVLKNMLILDTYIYHQVLMNLNPLQLIDYRSIQDNHFQPLKYFYSLKLHYYMRKLYK